MTCCHPIKVWQQVEARLDIPPRDYYALKKVNFHETPGRIQIEIPCGHCLGCRLDHANMWATRIMNEASNWKKNCYLTLTYNDDNLPHDKKTGLNTLKKKDLQDFLKRLRFYEKGIETWIHPIKQVEEKPIRYFACGEYGMKGKRRLNGGHPHYHLAIFNWIPDDLKDTGRRNEYGDIFYSSEKLNKIWGKGFVTIEDLNYNSACYIARYVQKKAGISPQERVYSKELIPETKIDERNGQEFIHYKRKIIKPFEPHQPEFLTMSRGVGIGRTYWDNNKEKIKRNGGILIKIDDKVTLKQIPRYYKKLWEDENWVEYYRWKYEKQKEGIIKKAEIISMVKLPDGTTNAEKYEFYLKTKEETLKSKTAHLKRNKLE